MAAMSEPLPSPPADLLVVNGRVFAGGDPRRPDALPPGSRDGPPPEGAPTAVAVAGERIAWVGRDAEVAAWRGPLTEVVDARGGLVLPGFEDAHIHFRMGAISLRRIDLLDAYDYEAIEATIRGYAAAHPEAPWVLGRGWYYASFPGGMPNRAQLDAMVPDRPAVMECYDGHTMWLNSLALARAGIDRETPDPPNGEIERDPATGEPTGILKEAAAWLIDRVVPEPEEEETLATLGEAIALAHRHGLTAVQDAWAMPEEFAWYERLRDAGALTLRIRLAMYADAAPWRDGPEAGARAWEERLDAYGAAAEGRRDDSWLSTGIVKAFADGVVESRTAWLLEPYDGLAPDAPGARGLPNWTPETLSAMTVAADRRGWQVEIHAIGDGGVRAALDAHAAARRANGRPDRRGRLEHIETIDAADIARFGREGVIASMQPFHADPTPNQAQLWTANIGARAERAWVWRSILAAGGVVAFGSDWPVVRFDPRLHLNMAVNRTTRDGRPPGGWLPEQRLPVSQALAAYTWGSAYAAFGEGWRGTLEAGKVADLVVLDRDLLADGGSAILGTEVRLTVAGGRVVHRGP